jgi:hypothetical protein
METQSGAIELVTKSELLGLESWNQPRSTEQLLGFIARREAEIFTTGDEI